MATDVFPDIPSDCPHPNLGPPRLGVPQPGAQWVASLIAHGAHTGTAKCHPPHCGHSHSPQPSSVPRLSGDRVRSLSWGSDSCRPCTCSEPRGLIPATRPTAPRGGDQLHLQTGRMRGGWRLSGGTGSVGAEACPQRHAAAQPSCSSRGPAGHLPGGRTLGRGPWCLRLPPGQAEQEAEGLGPTWRAPSTHGWLVPRPVSSPSDHYQGAP